MDEHQREPLPPPLRPHRVIPADAGAMPWEGLPGDDLEQGGESWLASSPQASSPVLAEGGRVLAERTWLVIEKASPMLASLPTVLQAAAAPDVAFQQVASLGSHLLALKEQMATGLEASLARVDWLFSELLNAPGRPGMIEQVIDALFASDKIDEVRADEAAEIEVLRGLHRDLVTLHQTWEALLEATFSLGFPLPEHPLLAGDLQAEPARPAAGARTSDPLPHASAPLPAGGGGARVASGGATARAFRRRPVSQHRQQLAVVLAVLMLVLAGTGVVFLQGLVPPANPTRDVASSRNPPTSLPSTPSPPTQPQPTSTQPVATPTSPSPSPSPLPQPSPTQPATQNGWFCPSGSAFCVSTVQVPISCSGDGSGSFQLRNNLARKVNWQASFTPGAAGTQVTISPSSGRLKVAQQVTLTVQTTNQGQALIGTIRIMGPAGTVPITVTVQGCG